MQIVLARSAMADVVECKVAQKEEMGRGRQIGEMKRRQSLILPRFGAGRDQFRSGLDRLEPWLRTSGICRIQKEVYLIL